MISIKEAKPPVVGIQSDSPLELCIVMLIFSFRFPRIGVRAWAGYYQGPPLVKSRPYGGVKLMVSGVVGVVKGSVSEWVGGFRGLRVDFSHSPPRFQHCQLALDVEIGYATVIIYLLGDDANDSDAVQA